MVKRKKKENSTLKGFRIGAGIVLGIIAMVVIIFWFFTPSLEIEFDGAIEPTLNINSQKGEEFCPKIEDINISKVFHFEDGSIALSIGEKIYNNYKIISSASQCRKAFFEGENENNVYCILMINKMDTGGIILSSKSIQFEFNPKLENIIKVYC